MALVPPTCQGSHLPRGLGAPNTLPPKEGSPQSAAGPQLRSRVAERKGLMFRILATNTGVWANFFSESHFSLWFMGIPSPASQDSCEDDRRVKPSAPFPTRSKCLINMACSPFLSLDTPSPTEELEASRTGGSSHAWLSARQCPAQVRREILLDWVSSQPWKRGRALRTQKPKS